MGKVICFNVEQQSLTNSIATSTSPVHENFEKSEVGIVKKNSLTQKRTIETKFYSNDWTASEFSTLNLGDKRRNLRFIKLEQERSTNINAPISETCASNANTKAAYRFYDNKHVKQEEILRAHLDSVVKRANTEKTLIAIQDTTEFNYGTETKLKGLGVMNDVEHFGFLLHNNIVYNTDKLPLGIISQEYIVRSAEEFGKRDTCKNRPIEEKESMKWINALRETHKFTQRIPDVKVITVADRECDIFDFFLEVIKLDETVIVRAAKNRVVEGEQQYLWPYLENCQEVGQVTIRLPIKDSHRFRDAIFSVKYSSVNIFPPSRRQHEHLDKIRLNAVYLKEITDQEEIVSWLLLTNMKVESLEDALLIVKYYTQRWSIEIFHKILKSGSRILERQFKSIKNIERFITLDSICGLRIQAMTVLGRGDEGKTPCSVIFDKEEWDSLYCFINKQKTLPTEIPTLNQMTTWIATLGGFRGRKGDNDPGIAVMWRGMQRFSDIFETWKLLKT